MKRYVGKKTSIATGVVTAFLAAAPGSSQATPTGAPDASALSSGATVSEAAADAIRSKAEEVNVKVAETKTPPIVKPVFRRAFAQGGTPFVRTAFARAGTPFVQSTK
jgi:hypothetical protein